MTISNTIRFEDWEAERMRDPEFRAAVEELEPAYQIARLRIMRGLTQQQLAELVGTKQSSIARLESGNAQPSLSFLRRVVEALGGRLVVQIMAQEEITATSQIPITVTDRSDAYSEQRVVHVLDWPQQQVYPYLDDSALAVSH